MKNQKGFIVPLLLGIIAILVIGGGVYVYKNKKVEAPIVIDDTQMNNSNSEVKNDSSITINKDEGRSTKSYCTAEEFSKNITKDLPKDVKPIVDRIIICNHWGGEVGSGDPQREREVEKGAEADKCDTIDKDKSDFIGKYSLNQKVIDAINAADSWDERSCTIAQISENNTSNWKTYTNTKYGFEVKIPSNLSVSESQPAGIPRFTFSLGEGKGAFSVSIFSSHQLLTEAYGPDWKNKSTIVMSGYQTRVLERTINQYTSTSYVIDVKNVSIDFEDSQFSSVNLTLDKILYTFKFTK